MNRTIIKDTHKLESPEVIQTTGNNLIKSTCTDQGHRDDNYRHKKHVEKKTLLLTTN